MILISYSLEVGQKQYVCKDEGETINSITNKQSTTIHYKSNVIQYPLIELVAK